MFLLACKLDIYAEYPIIVILIKYFSTSGDPRTSEKKVFVVLEWDYYYGIYQMFWNDG